MIAVVQRTLWSSVHISNQPTVKCGNGLTVLLGIATGDTQKDADYLIAKISKLRIFEDENGKMNLNIQDVQGECMIVSQFTLCGSCKKGNRPSFTQAASPEIAKELYQYFLKEFKKTGIKTHSGTFQAEMGVELWNHGPVTLILES